MPRKMFLGMGGWAPTYTVDAVDLWNVSSPLVDVVEVPNDVPVMPKTVEEGSTIGRAKCEKCMQWMETPCESLERMLLM